MKARITTLLLILFAYQTFAQFENIDLSKYKLPDLKRRELDLNFNLNSDFRKYYPFHKLFSNHFDNRIQTNYFEIRNSEKVQRNSRVNFDVSYLNEVNHEKNTSPESKKSLFESEFTIDVEQREYFKPKFFILFNPSFSFSGRKSDSDNNLNWRKENSISFIPEIFIAPGIGRIEPVGDMRHTLYILEDLQKNNRLSRIPSENEIFKIATFISKLKNKRFFDSRLKQIEDITLLDSLLSSLDLKSKSDARYFTSINDLWLYDNEFRESGKRFQFGTKYRMNYSSTTLWEALGVSSAFPEEIKTKNIRHTNVIETSYEWRKPIGLKWQRNIDGIASFERVQWKDLQNKSNSYSINHIQLNAMLSYLWFLNTRTNLNFGVSGQYGIDSKIEPKTSDNNLLVYFFGGLNYYFSPQFRLSYHAQLINYSDFKNNFPANSNWRITNQIALKYSIF